MLACMLTLLASGPKYSSGARMFANCSIPLLNFNVLTWNISRHFDSVIQIQALKSVPNYYMIIIIICFKSNNIQIASVVL